jgi:hypothetical protein
VPEITGSPQVEAYPNPVREQLVLRYTNVNPSAILQLFNLYGQVVYRENVLGSGQLIVDPAGFSSGTYFFRMKNEQSDLMGRIMIMR